MFSLDGYLALRRGAGLVRRTDRGVLSATGPDRLTWLQGLLTNDVRSLPIGGLVDAAWLTPQGRMITELRVIQLARETLLDVPASLAASLTAKLEGLLFAEDAHVADRSAGLAIIDLHGPEAGAVRDRAAGTIAARALAVVPDAPFGVPGVSVVARTGDVETLVSAIVQCGAIETTLDTLDVVRVEAGRPAFLVDMDDHTIPLEAGIEDRVISFTKGCYVGQEVIVRVRDRGHGRVARKLVGLTFGASALPARGDPVVASGRDVGRLTSVVSSPTLGHTIALGWVHRDFTAPGTMVAVRSERGPIAAEITPLPFVRA
jgi:folate-binding protein YgfZ